MAGKKNKKTKQKEKKLVKKKPAQKISVKPKKVQKPKKVLAAAKKKKPLTLLKPKKTKKIQQKENKKPQVKPAPKKSVKPEIQKTETPFSAESLFKARIKVVGIGGGGGSIVSEIGKSLDKATFVIADTDIRALKKRPGVKYFWFGEEFTHGLGTGVNVDLGRQAAESVKEKISDFFKDQDIIIFIASLGGGLGSGAAQIFAEQAKKFGAITLGIFTLPFRFEGKNKSRIALNALKSLKEELNVSITIPNEKIFKVIDETTPITAAFSMVNKSLIGSLESLINLIYNPGIINIDFADFRTILKGKGSSAFLNTVEESGKDRAEKICQSILVNPLLQGGGGAAEKILFNIAGSDNLSMFEVEKISSHISNLNPEAKIIFGISKNPKLKNKIKTTILMTGGGRKEEDEKVEKKIELVRKQKTVIAKKPVEKILKKKKEAKPGKQTLPELKIKSVPVAEVAIAAKLASAEPKISLPEAPLSSKKTLIRRSALEIKRAEEEAEQKRTDQEKEWEIPAFLRRVKFNK